MVVSTEGKMHENEQLLNEERCFLFFQLSSCVLYSTDFCLSCPCTFGRNLSALVHLWLSSVYFM